MAETDILNPVQGFWATINDNPNPSYGFTRKTNANAQLARARMGSWYQRDNANDGYSFALSFMNRPWTTMLRLKQFYEIGKSGYFTVIDYDGGGRHHVGRFTSEPNPTQVANGKYNVQNLIFEEIPQARMLSYPSDFVNWTRTINVVDDFLNCAVAYQGNWTLQDIGPSTFHPATPEPPSSYPTPARLTVPSNYGLVAGTAAAGDFAQVQYVGFGFQIVFPISSTYGTWDLLVDGQTVITALNFTNGECLSEAGYVPYNSPVSLYTPIITPNIVGPIGSTVTVSMPQIPLDVHRVKVVRNVNLNMGLPMAFPQMTVIV